MTAEMEHVSDFEVSGQLHDADLGLGEVVCDRADEFLCHGTLLRPIAALVALSCDPTYRHPPQDERAAFSPVPSDSSATPLPQQPPF